MFTLDEQRGVSSSLSPVYYRTSTYSSKRLAVKCQHFANLVNLASSSFFYSSIPKVLESYNSSRAQTTIINLLSIINFQTVGTSVSSKGHHLSAPAKSESLIGRSLTRFTFQCTFNGHAFSSLKHVLTLIYINYSLEVAARLGSVYIPF